MRISTKGKYGLLIMTYLAKEYQNGRYVSLKEISESENISVKYLEKIIMSFRKSNYLESSRGSVGGYKLAYSPDKYTIKDIISKSEGEIELVSCLNGNFKCNKKAMCTSMKLWKELNDVINDYLENKTLEDLIKE